jgi:hypothetical protein
MIIYGELEWTGKEEIVAYFKILSQHLPGMTDKNHEKACHITTTAA